MPATITLRNLTYVTPDGHSLFHDLDLVFGPQRTGLVGRNGVGKTTLLNLAAGTLAPTSGDVQVEGKLAFLRQAVQVDPDETIAQALGVAPALALLERVEAGQASLEEIADADWTLPARIEARLTELGLPALAMQRRHATLSGGQRTRLALAAMLLDEPDLVILDEPTNNLDRDGRRALAEFLGGWRGGALVVSHDRALLGHMDAIVELTTLGARVYGGNWAFYAERKATELAAAEQNLETTERRVVEIDRKVQEQRERKARRDASGQRKRERGDLPKILLDARKERAEKTGGGQARLADRLRQQAGEAAAEARAQVEILQKLSVALAPTGLPAGKVVLQLTDLTGGPDPQQPVIRGLSVTMTGPERVAVTGPNGVGKTTLLRLITGELAPLGGLVQVVRHHALLDQEVSLLDPATTIRDNFLRLNPGAGENACRAALARFLFRAEAALQPVGTLSGGQMLRAGLACVLGGEHPPELLLLDEPTNHLDLEAIAAVEAGLGAYDGALLVVSHDETFLEAIGIGREIALGAS